MRASLDKCSMCVHVADIMVGQSPSARINLPLPLPHNKLPPPQVKHMHSPEYRFCLYDTQLRVYIPQVPLVHMSLRDTCVTRIRGCASGKKSFFVHETLWMYTPLSKCQDVEPPLCFRSSLHTNSWNVHEYICDKCDTSERPSVNWVEAGCAGVPSLRLHRLHPSSFLHSHFDIITTGINMVNDIIIKTTSWSV